MSKRRNRIEKNALRPADTVSPKKIKASSAAGGWNSMTNWLIVLVMVLPVLFSESEIDPTMTIRYIFLGCFMFLLILFFYARKKTQVNLSLPLLTKALFISGIGFAAWSLFAWFSAINIAAGYYEIGRHLLNLLLLFLVMIVVQQEESQVLKLCKAVMLVSLVQSFVGILQFYDVAFADIPGNYIPYGLMANRNLFGSAQALVLPFVIFVLYKGGKRWKYASGLALAGLIISIIISQTRSAWLSTLAILLIPLILIPILSAPNRKKWIMGSLIAIVAIAAITSLLLAVDKEGVLSKSVKERAVSLATTAADSSESSGNVQERLKIWKKTIALIKDKPLFGVGPGNWRVAIPAYGTEGLVWAGGYYVPDRPHNVYLLVASETGIPGAILYFASWLLLAIIGFKIILKTTSEDRRILVILMLAGLAAFASDSMFSFPAERIEHSLYMILMGGIILGCYANHSAAEKEKRGPLGKNLVIVFFIITAFNVFIGFKKHYFEKHLNYARAYDKSGQYQQVIQEVEAGKNMFVSIDPLGKSLEIYSSVAYKELKDYKKALQESNRAKRFNPNSAMVYNNMGNIYTDMQQYDTAIQCYLKAIKLAPEFEIVFKNLAVNYFQKGDYTACLDALKKANINGDTYLTSLMNEAKRKLESQGQNK